MAGLLASELTHGTKYRSLNQIAWDWTERFGKYKGCPYWSKAADRLIVKTPKTLRHEHVVPRKIVLDMLFKLDPPSLASVREICEKFLIGVVVTLEENARLNNAYKSKMPTDFFDPESPHYRDPWLRYNLCGIEILPRIGEMGHSILVS